MIRSPKHHIAWDSTWVYMLPWWGLTRTNRSVLCVPIDTRSLQAVSAMLAIASREHVVAAALQVRANKREAAFCAFKFWFILRLLSKKLKFQIQFWASKFPLKREKNKIEYNAREETSLFFRRKPLPDRCLHYPTTGRSQYLQSGLPWITSILGNSKCDHTWD